MKKYIFLLFAVLSLFASFHFSAAAEGDEWKEKPVITHIYEIEKDKLLAEWEGNSLLYQVYVDGKEVSTVNLNYAVINIKEGTHQIAVIPIEIKSKEGNKNLSLNLDLAGNSNKKNNPIDIVFDVLGISGITGGINLDLDLGALGVDPKDIIPGTRSDSVKLKYTANSIITSTPEIKAASTDLDSRTSLTFTDKYDANFYQISVKNGNDLTYVTFDTAAENSSELITKNNSSVTVILDPEYLRSQECMVPELDQKYSFSVKLQKYPTNYVDGKKDSYIILESKESKAFDYTPSAPWKNAPVISYTSQTADGQITLQWEHDDNGFGCEYKVVKQDVFLGIKKGEEEVGKTAEKEFVINDLMNGKYTYAVIPVYAGEEGFSSEGVTVEINNNWVTAPVLKYEKENNNQVVLKWNAADGVDKYHITVFVGDGSLLRFVNLDYKKYEEFDIDATPGSMEFTYKYDQPADLENGVNLKFEIYAVRYAADGTEQKSAASAQTVMLKGQ